MHTRTRKHAHRRRVVYAYVRVCVHASAHVPTHVRVHLHVLCIEARQSCRVHGEHGDHGDHGDHLPYLPYLHRNVHPATPRWEALLGSTHVQHVQYAQHAQHVQHVACLLYMRITCTTREKLPLPMRATTRYLCAMTTPSEIGSSGLSSSPLQWGLYSIGSATCASSDFCSPG